MGNLITIAEVPVMKRRSILFLTVVLGIMLSFVGCGSPVGLDASSEKEALSVPPPLPLVVLAQQGGDGCPEAVPEEAECGDADLDFENRVGISLLNYVDFSDPRCARYANAVSSIINRDELWGHLIFEDKYGRNIGGFTHDPSERIGIAHDVEDDEVLAYIAIHEAYHVTDGLGDDGGWNEDMMAHGWAEACTGYEMYN
jgi:hypothetical protein